MKVKNNLKNKLLYAILVVLSSTANFAYAQNISFASVKPAAAKLGFAMFGILLCSILIWLGLSLYNRFFVAKQIKDFKMAQDSLKSPIDKEEAIKMFITKNRVK